MILKDFNLNAFYVPIGQAGRPDVQREHIVPHGTIPLLVDPLSGDHYEVHLVRYEERKHLTQPAIRLWVTAKGYNFASSLYIFMQREHSDSRETVSKLTIEGKTVDAEAARRSDEDWTRAIRRTLFLLSTAEHRNRHTIKKEATCA